MSLLKSISAFAAANSPKSSTKHADRRSTVRWHVEKTQPLGLAGWACATDAAAERFEVVVGGQVLECGVIRFERADVRDALGVERLALGFELEIPSAIWLHAGGGDVVQVQPTVNGEPVGKAPLALSIGTLQQQGLALREQEHALAPEDSQARAEWQYQVLLLVEHVAAAGALARLVPEVRAFLERQAAAFNVASALAVPDAPGAGLPRAALPAALHDFETTFVWRILREFNRGLATQGDDPGAILDRILAENVYDDEVVHRVVVALVPHFCSVGRYERLRPRVDAARLRKLSTSGWAHDLSLLLPELVAAGDLGQATHVLKALAAQPPGWVNTECVHAAVAMLVDGLEAGQPVDAAATNFTKALEDFLWAEGTSYWSRLHDRHLVAAAIGLVRLCPALEDEVLGEVVWNLRRNFTLVPLFWDELARTLPDRSDWPVDLVEAESDARRLFAWLRGDRHGLDEFEAHLPLLMRVRAFGSVDADVVLREAMLAMAPQWASTELPRLRAIFDTLGTIAASEPLRFAAHPLATQAVLDAAPPLRERIRACSGVRSLPHHAVYERAVALVGAVRADGTEGVQACLHRIYVLAQQLMAPQASCIGGWVLASGVVAAWDDLDHAQRAGWLSRVRGLWKRAIEGHPEQRWPAASVLGVWSQLCGLAEHDDHADLHHLVAEMRRMLRHRIGEEASARLAPAGPLAMRAVRGTLQGRTLVAIYSCRKNLSTRIERIRATWMRDLQRLGMPYVVVVGEGDDQLHGDVLELDVSDAYEALPAKTLKLLAWMHDRTDFDHLFKIDDDCHLAVELFERASTHVSHHYAGRRLTRQVGATDRRWHNGRSSTALADRALDKSPEPATYADGGSAYALSRLAIGEVLDALRTPAGARLTRGAYMEDKLLGDLLALRGFALSSEGHQTFLRRRFGPGAVPVNAWHSTFLPGPLSPTFISHLDDAEAMADAQAGLAQRRLVPPRLWPTHAAPDLVFTNNVNQLELLSPVAGVAALRDAPVIVVAVARNERVLMPHFLDHYRRIGASHFVLVDNLSDDGTREYLLAQPDVVLYSADTDYKESHFGVAWQQAVLAAHALGKWVVLADIDEFLVYDDLETRTLPDWLRGLEAEGADAAMTLMIDMYPQGDMAGADFGRTPPFEACPMFEAEPLTTWRMGSGTFSNCLTYVSALRHRVIPDSAPNSYTSQKIAVLKYRPWVRLTQGLHYASNLRLAARNCFFAHFKYHAGFKQKVLTEVARKQHFNDAEEYVRYMSLLAEAGGDLSGAGCSTPYVDSRSFTSLALAQAPSDPR